MAHPDYGRIAYPALLRQLGYVRIHRFLRILQYKVRYFPFRRKDMIILLFDDFEHLSVQNVLFTQL